MAVETMDLQCDRYVNVSEAGVGEEVDTSAAKFLHPCTACGVPVPLENDAFPKKVLPAKSRSPTRLTFDDLRSQVSR